MKTVISKDEPLPQPEVLVLPIVSVREVMYLTINMMRRQMTLRVLNIIAVDRIVLFGEGNVRIYTYMVAVFLFTNRSKRNLAYVTPGHLGYHRREFHFITSIRLGPIS